MKITKTNYYSKKIDEEYMSYSQFKDFDKCPAMAMAKLDGSYQPEYSDSLLVGSYVDAWLDGQLVKFKEKHPEIFNSRTGELKANFQQAEDICKIIKKDKYLYKQLKGKRQMVVTGNIAGVKFKGRLDSLLEDKIVDGKVLKDCADVWQDGERKPFYKANRYDIQGAIYKTLYQQETGKDLDFYLAVVTKEKQPDKRLFKFSNQTLDDALQEIIAKAPVFDAMKQGKEEVWACGVCDYCKMQKFLSENDIEIL